MVFLCYGERPSRESCTVLPFTGYLVATSGYSKTDTAMSSGNSNKRPRIDKSDGDYSDEEVKQKWVSLKEWIHENGGYIHPSLEWKSNRQVATTSPLVKGTQVAKIPSNCLLSLATLGQVKLHKEREHQDVNSSSDDKDDVALAWALAQECYNNNNNNCTGSKQNQASRFAPYFATLPESFEHLPRYWSSQTLDDLLTGSPLLDRIRKQDTQGKYREQQKKKKSISPPSPTKSKNDNDEDNCSKESLPTLEQFDFMMAAVSSRAFGGLVVQNNYNNDGGNGTTTTTTTELDCLCPFLDLLDHSRGNSGPKKNVKYDVETTTTTRDGDDDDHGCTTRTFVVVRMIEDVPSGTILRDTYGARGNGQLLMNYGFCVPNNVEPDGSSNDVLDFHYNESVVELRFGPKAYSYGPFVKALELFYTPKSKKDTEVFKAKGMNERDSYDEQEDDMEAFLNSCENEEDEEENDDDWDDDEGGGDGDDNIDDPSGDNTDLEEELRAFEKFRMKLEEKKDRYSLKGDRLKAALQNMDSSSKYFAAVLVSSEQRTLDFLVRVIDILCMQLSDQHEKRLDDNHNGHHPHNNDQTLEKHATELVKAFVHIRHPNLISKLEL